MHFRIIVTDVTDFGSDHHCIAGWDVSSRRMIRPEPAPASSPVPASFWPAAHVGPDSIFWAGHVVEFEGDILADQALPHATEDVLVRPTTIRLIERVDVAELPSLVAGSVAPDLDALFSGQLARMGSTPHVPAGANCRSLGGIEIDRAMLTLSVDRWDENKLRGMIRGPNVNLKVPATTVRRAFLEGGLPAAQALLPERGRIQVRIGLSRPFPARPNECFVQINGLYPIPTREG
jgi:putative nucleic acid modification protein with dual OB domain